MVVSYLFANAFTSDEQDEHPELVPNSQEEQVVDVVVDQDNLAYFPQAVDKHHTWMDHDVVEVDNVPS